VVLVAILIGVRKTQTGFAITRNITNQPVINQLKGDLGRASFGEGRSEVVGMKRPRKILLCERDHHVDSESVIKLIHEYEEYIDWLEKEKPDYISWHSVERIQELEKRVRKIEEVLPAYKILKPEPHTCGECRRPWRKESDGGMIFMLACRHNKKPDKEVSWRSEDDEACGKFKSRGESCT
jgi:hypothetical protein